ncbi:hypothetical protein SDC9_166595 [bioreactor metagenome]|uniref:Xylose isomerase-like TIM barrel domain-containing protein n=1 Tax=bioreactor metagenome TaxID=1076179 RepID=A0A645G030_9ZZZZ
MKTMKLSAPDWCFFPKGADPDAYYRKLKAMGYSGVEMVEPERWQSAKNAGLEIVNLAGPGMADGMNRRENRRKLSDEILRLTESAAKNAIPYLIVFSGNKGDLSYKEGLENCLEGYGALLDQMKGSGVKLLFEMLNSFDHKDYQADTESFGFELARKLDNENFRLLYDIYHMVRGGCDPLRNLEEKLPYIAHFHVASLEGRKFPEPDGAIDYKAFFAAVPEGRFRGYVGMEFFPADSGRDLTRAADMFLDAAE